MPSDHGAEQAQSFVPVDNLLTNSQGAALPTSWLRMSDSSRVQKCDSLTACTGIHKIEFDMVGFLQ